MRRQVGIKLEEGLIARVDAARGGQSRTEWFEGALEARLGESGRSADAAANYGVRPARGVGGSRVVSSAGAKVGVVPRWRGTGTDGKA